MNNIAWKCENCDWVNSNPSLTGPIMHEISQPGHKTIPAEKAIHEWGKVL